MRALARARPAWPHPAVAFESPQRLPASLAALAEVAPEQPVAVCRELTKLHEEVVRGTAAELAERFATPPKGEVTLVLGPGAAAAGGRARPRAAAVADLVAEGVPRRRAAGIVAALTGVSREPALRRLSVAAFDNGRRRCYRSVCVVNQSEQRR